MPIDIDFVAIVLMESVGIFFFLITLIFWRQIRRVEGKIESLQDALKKAGTMWKGVEGRCYSFDWVITKSHQNLVAARASLMILAALLPIVVVPFIFLIFYNIGYALFIPLVGLAIFLDEDAFEAYNYIKAILKVADDRLDVEDQEYLEIARKTLVMATIRIVVAGITIITVGPFTPTIVNSLCFGLALYANILFQVANMPLNITRVFGILVAEVLSGILIIVLPQQVVRTLYNRTKGLAQRTP